uniref:DNA repair protein REV1 n=1 Tax=Sparus aurata TaxID=8175 RepID=A0A671XRT9_SPAAU
RERGGVTRSKGTQAGSRTRGGGYMAAKVSKLDEQFKLDAPREKQKDGSCSSIFSGVSIYVNGYTEPSADELRRLMMLHGGQFHVYYSRSKTTHIIANNLPNSKIKELKGEKVIRPEWITDSIKAGHLLPYLQYQLYAKHKGPLFPGMTLRQTSEIAGPSQASVHYKLHLPPCSLQPSVLNHEQSSSSSFKISEDKPQNPHTKHDPYEFPHSPPKQSDQSPVSPEHSSSQGASGQRPPPPTYQEAIKATENHLKQLQPSCQVNSDPEKTPLSPASRPLSHAPIRLNGSHHNAFSFDTSSLNTSDVTTKPDPPTEKSSPSKSSAQLLAQTGGLISEFYSHSRLHQISTWRSGFSEYVNELHSKRKAAGANSFCGKERLRKSVAQHSAYRQGTSASIKSCILHVDMDCFFVSVGIRHRPDLKGKPVAVTSNRGEGTVPRRAGANPQLEQQYYQRKYAKPQPGEILIPNLFVMDPDSHTNGVDQDAAILSMAEIASCSYEARQAGVRNGMFFGKAKQLCPALQSVPYDFEAYKEVALTMYETLASYTHDIEALSCDEVLIDGSALIVELGVSPADLASAIRADIKEKTGCCASVGMGSNILLARLATRKAKPDGQYFLKSEEVDDFIRDLPVTSLPGVGPVMGRKLAAMGVRSCGDLQQVSLSQLQKKFGPRTGQTLFRFCRGLDDRPVRYEKERKSVSAEMNYNIRFTRVDEAECFLTNLSMEVQKRLKEAGLRGRRVTLKMMVRKIGAPLEPAKYGGHGICDNLARTVMLAEATDNGQLIATAVIKLFHAMKLQVQDLRGIGIQVQLLEGNHSSCKDTAGTRMRSIKEMLVDQGSSARSSNKEKTSSMIAPSSGPSPHPLSPPEPVPGTSRDQQACRQTPKNSRARLNLSIEVPSPSQVDRSVLEALPADLREQVEHPQPAAPPPQPPALKSRPISPPCPPTSAPAFYTPPVGTLVLQIPNQPDSHGIVLELPNFSQVRTQPFEIVIHFTYHKNPLLQLKQSGVGIGLGRVKRRYKRKNAVSPVKKGPSPMKRHPTTTINSSSNSRLFLFSQTEYGPSTSTSKPDIPESKSIPRPAPALAGAYDLTDIKTLLREWVTTMTDPMEEDILQVVKYCTELIDYKDLEKLDLIVKYMKRLMQQSVESVWSMAFDFILDNVQVVVQQTYGSTLKIT